MNISLQLSTVETVQIASIATSIISLAWCFSEYHSVRKNMLLDITVSPLSRIVMFFYMMLQVSILMTTLQCLKFFFGIFDELLYSQNVNLARFARNVECDFLCDFQTCQFLKKCEFANL